MDIATYISALLLGGAIVAFIVILFVMFEKKKENKIEYKNIENPENPENPEIKITREEFDEQTYIQAQKEAKNIVINRMAKKFERKITKGLFDNASSAKTARKYYKKTKSDVIDISEVKSILGENNTENKRKKRDSQINQSLAATQEFTQSELKNLIKN